MQHDVNVKVKIDTNKINRQYRAKQQKALRMLKSEIAKDTEPYVPMRDGRLRRAVTTSLRTNDPNLIWATPYARFIYYGKVMVGRITRRAWAKKGETKVTTGKELTYSQPGTGPNWFNRAKKQRLQKWIKVARKVFK